MFLDFTEDQERLRAELRAYFSSLMTPELKKELADTMGGELHRRTVRQMGTDGWLGVGWPTEYGGRGFSAVEQHIFFEEAQRAEAPLPLVTLNTVGPAIMQFGTEEQRARCLPAILRGELFVAIGYSETEAGTDLASLATRAERDGDEWIINGQKMWTTGAEDADYVWLAVRTDPNAKKHKGITMFLVDMTLPGISVQPIWTLPGHRTNVTFYEDVRVPDSAVIGEVNQGWRLITTQLNYERTSIVGTSTINRLFDEVARYAAATPAPEGGTLLDRPWVRLNLARVRAETEALRLSNARVASMIAHDALDGPMASAVKVHGTEFTIEAYRLLLEIVGPVGLLAADSPGSILHGHLERQWRRATLTTFGGGVNEIQRDIIAMLALGMPPSPR